ncbi:uncharacterized protein BX663DRAFT_514532 [Cokeromyces recurvatus]|uniref:uncharacterized protein n=1 Tax=Cokeromyces recurvatus TaxID=90255 RepID=UPI00221FE09A|nr:uncharacterized protein BX663DRAFT_514532 [Cokeromyces recurvatus]KAI7901473.1 hypothetical protein BX663DRAFT_514532 [Cokeromyces recurvatus]
MAEDIKRKIKFDELKKRYREVEEENELLQAKLRQARKNIKRLRLEKTILLERIDKGYNHADNHSDSDTSLDILTNNDFMDMKHNFTLSNKHKHNNHFGKNNNTATTIIKPPKKKKDPNAPKGPGNVFFLFCRMEREKIKDENPEENLGDVTKLLSLKWKSLSKEDKQIYYDTFKKEMEEYEEAMKTYKSNINNDNNNLNASDENSQRRSQSVDPIATEDSIKAEESLASSSVITSPEDSSTLNLPQENELLYQNNPSTIQSEYPIIIENSFEKSATPQQSL